MIFGSNGVFPQNYLFIFFFEKEIRTEIFLRNKGGGLSHNYIIGMNYINYMLTIHTHK